MEKQTKTATRIFAFLSVELFILKGPAKSTSVYVNGSEYRTRSGRSEAMICDSYFLLYMVQDLQFRMHLRMQFFFLGI